MKAENKKYQIVLSLFGGVGDVVGKKLLSHFGSAKEVFYANKYSLNKIDGVGKVLVE